MKGIERVTIQVVPQKEQEPEPLLRGVENLGLTRRRNDATMKKLGLTQRRYGATTKKHDD